MFKIRNLIWLCACLASGPVMAQDEPVDRAALAQCFAMAERLERLACYDRVLGRPDLTDTAGLPPPTMAPKPYAVTELDALLSTPYVSADTVRITLRDATSGAALSRFDTVITLDDFDARLDGDALFRLRTETDLFLTLPSLSDIGETAALVISCQNNITRLQVFWNAPFPNSQEDVRLYYGTSVSDQTHNETRRFRVRSDGYILENARGLDSIRLIRDMSSTHRTQISVNSGADVRSAFFTTDALTSAIPYLARHCSWSQP